MAGGPGDTVLPGHRSRPIAATIPFGRELLTWVSSVDGGNPTFRAIQA